MKKAIILYLPVMHQGYVNFLRKHNDADAIFLIGEILIQNLATSYPDEASLRSLMRDPRCLDSDLSALLLEKIFPSISISIEDFTSSDCLTGYEKIIMPDEQICKFLYSNYPEVLSREKVEYEQTFLRWDLPSAIANVHVESDFTIASDDLFILGLGHIQNAANQDAKKSSDWWRQVGGVLFREKEIILVAHNHHLPTEYETEFQGDPRSNFQAGEYIEFSSAIHAEAGLIGTVAKKGICSEGLEMFTTTFPCPACAALIATSGIKRLYFNAGYSNVNALATLREHGVEIVRVT